METFVDFFSLKHYIVRIVLIGVVLLGICSSLVGTFTFLRKRALVGDVVAHSILPGICLAFLLSGNKDPWILLLGAFVTGWISILLVDYIAKNSKIKIDTANALVLSVFFGIGILLLGLIQNSSSSAHAGLQGFIIGKPTDLLKDDLLQFILLSLVLISVMGLLFKEFKLLAFDPDFATIIGLPTKFLEFLLATLTVLTIAIGIQAVGMVLMAAMLITPVAAARYWTSDLRKMIFWAALFATVSGILGTYVSYVYSNMPTGPWIIVFLTFFVVISIFSAPNRGIVARWLAGRRFQRKMLEENILKMFFHLGEKHQDFFSPRKITELAARRSLPGNLLQKGLRQLLKQHLLLREGGEYIISEAGLKRAKRIIKIHRLWEIYLSEYLNIKSDHVHDDAEAIEHIITPELERELEKLLQSPETDPHGKQIPYYE